VEGAGSICYVTTRLETVFVISLEIDLMPFGSRCGVGGEEMSLRQTQPSLAPLPFHTN